MENFYNKISEFLLQIFGSTCEDRGREEGGDFTHDAQSRYPSVTSHDEQSAHTQLAASGFWLLASGFWQSTSVSQGILK